MATSKTENLGLNVFSTGDKILASEINTNFQTLEDNIDMSAKIVGTAHDGGSATSFTITLPTTDYDYLTVKIECPIPWIFSNYGLTSPSTSPYRIYTIKKPSSSYTFYFKTLNETYQLRNSSSSSYAYYYYSVLDALKNQTGVLDGSTLTLSNFYSKIYGMSTEYPYYAIEVVQYKYS